MTDKGKGKESSTSETSVNLSSEQASSRILPLGFDMSAGLLGIAAGKGHEVVRGDCFDMSCWRSGAFVSNLARVAVIPEGSLVLAPTFRRTMPSRSLQSITLRRPSGEWSRSRRVQEWFFGTCATMS